eukprot:4523930-Pyramimonas_sp.AAC.1
MKGLWDFRDPDEEGRAWDRAAADAAPSQPRPPEQQDTVQYPQGIGGTSPGPSVCSAPPASWMSRGTATESRQ